MFITYFNCANLMPLGLFSGKFICVGDEEKNKRFCAIFLRRRSADIDGGESESETCGPKIHLFLMFVWLFYTMYKHDSHSNRSNQ